MINFGERDPEEVGPEHPEDTELRHRVMEARHEFVPGGDNGRCGLNMGHVDDPVDYPCNLEKWSVLHIDEQMDKHDHGGGDCMCFEAHEDQY